MENALEHNFAQEDTSKDTVLQEIERKVNDLKLTEYVFRTRDAHLRKTSYNANDKILFRSDSVTTKMIVSPQCYSCE